MGGCAGRCGVEGGDGALAELEVRLREGLTAGAGPTGSAASAPANTLGVCFRLV